MNNNIINKNINIKIQNFPTFINKTTISGEPLVENAQNFHRMCKNKFYENKIKHDEQKFAEKI